MGDFFCPNYSSMGRERERESRLATFRPPFNHQIVNFWGMDKQDHSMWPFTQMLVKAKHQKCHQLLDQAFDGADPRICATCHAGFEEEMML